MWSIACIFNNLIIPEKCAKELVKKNPEGLWDDLEDLLDYGNKDLLFFNDDHCEHMDYLSSPDIRKILLKHKVKGDVTFGSLDGDNFGKFWGYRFDGKGNMKELKGTIIWEEKT